MKNQRETIRKMVRYLNNRDKDGGFWLPNIQRPFVWSEEQIERLFDSLMREYPISTLLVWKTKAPVRRRSFIADYKHSLRLTDYYVLDDDKQKLLVLDGQQRLQSLFIGLTGSYEGKSLHFDVTSGELAAPDDTKYQFKFLDPAKAKLPWVRFADLVDAGDNSMDLADSIIEALGDDIVPSQRRQIRQHLAQVGKVFGVDEVLVYQELDSVDRPHLYTTDDVVEVFIRANSGGTRLDKSDLMFSLLISTWEEAEARTEQLVSDLNAKGYAFDRDFVLKSCLTVLDTGPEYKVDKFRDTATRERIEADWDRIEAAIREVVDHLYGKTYLRSDKALLSALVLIPVIYFRYHHPDRWPSVRGLNEYFARTLLAGTFSGHPDAVISQCVRTIRESGEFDLPQLFEAIRGVEGRTLEVYPQKLLDITYGSRAMHLVFSLWYDVDYRPAFVGNLPQVDHIFPQSLLKKVKLTNDLGHKTVMKYKDADRNQIANCMLLTAVENGSGGKGDTPPSEWFKGKPPEYLALHLIPPDPTLWELENYEAFIGARKLLILGKFAGITRPALTGQESNPRT